MPFSALISSKREAPLGTTGKLISPNLVISDHDSEEKTITFLWMADGRLRKAAATSAALASKTFKSTNKASN